MSTFPTAIAGRPLTKSERRDLYSYVFQIIDNLTPAAMKELLEGYNNDLDELFLSLLQETHKIVHIETKAIDPESCDYLPQLETVFDEVMKMSSFNYFKTTMLPSFEMGWRNIEWGNLVQLYPWSCFQCERGSGKCFAPGTKVVMYDGSLKNIEDIQVGDQVMGPDNTIRNVLKIHSGVDQMYKVEQKQSLDYVVNSKHELCIQHHGLVRYINKRGEKDWKTNWDIDSLKMTKISAEDFYNKSTAYKDESYGIKVKGWELTEQELKIEPYWLGLWLGDGSRISTGIASLDFEVIEYIKQYAERLDLRYSPSKGELHGINIDHSIVSSHGGSKEDKFNILLENLRFYNLYLDKHIPDEYLKGSRKQRLELLAGLIDSDGTYDGSSYSFLQKDLYLTSQVQLLCWSLGFRANIAGPYKNFLKSKGEDSYGYSLNFSGNIWEIPCKIKRKIAKVTKIKKRTTRCGVIVQPIEKGEYYGFTCDGDHLFILSDGTIVSNSFEFCFAFPLWRAWSYRRPNYLKGDSRENRNRKETVIITNESKLGIHHLEKVVEEIRLNEFLHEILLPDSRNDLGKEQVRTKNGASVLLRSKGSFIRGLHVGAAVPDDFLDKSCLYSKDQRDKFEEVFYAEIVNIVEPGGFLIVSGTPFHEKDLYWRIKNDPNFKTFIYPGIYPDGRILAPDRYTYDKLMELKESLGTVVFTREHLVKPISDYSSLFPWEYLNRAKIGMDKICLVNNIESFPVKMERVVLGCDFAISGAVSADYSVFSVWGRGIDKKYYLLYVYRKKGASHGEQVSQIVSINSRFQPNKIVAEGNGFQSIMIALVKERGVGNIEAFITESNLKKDLYEGLPSLSAMFERGEIKIPYGNEESRNTFDWLCGEFNSVTFHEDSGKLESSSDHDDGAMSTFFAVTDLREKKSTLVVHYI